MTPRFLISLFLLGCAPLLLLACGTTVVDVDDYDRSCTVDDDCVVVQDGDICCGCPNAAINKSDIEDYQDDIGTCQAQCDIGCLGGLEAFCSEGTCDVREVGVE